MPVNRATTILFVLALVLFGCQDELLHSVDAQTAQEAVGVLADNGVEARKVPQGKERFAVVVPRGMTLESLQILRSRGLPRASERNATDARGIVPSAMEDHLLLQRDTAQGLRESLLAVPGVVDARINLSLPPTRGFRQGPAPEPRASAVVRWVGTSPPLAESDVQRIVAAAVPGLEASTVAVLLTGAHAPAQAAARIVQVGPIAVHERSAATARASFAALLLLVMFFGATTAYATSRRR